MSETVILDPYFRKLDQIFAPAELKRLASFADIAWGKDEEMPLAELERHKPQAAAIVSGYWRHGKIEDYPKLRAFIEVGGGHPRPKDFDYAACFSRGIHVLSCAPAFAPAVAELALGMAIAAGRQIADQDKAFRRGEEIWETKGNEESFTLYEKTVGFVGFGSIARCLRALLAPFRCRVLAYDPWQTGASLAAQGAQPCSSLEQMLPLAKVIFVLAIPTPENKGLLDRQMLARIPSGAVFVLVSRSHLVDFDAMTEFVLEGKFKAAVDVFPVEPLPADHPIRGAKGAILTAHKGGSIPEGLRSIGRLVVNDLEAILAGLSPQHLQPARWENIKRLQ